MQPKMVQRCKLGGKDGIEYEYMGEREFERGDQARSLQRIFAEGYQLITTSITWCKQEFKVWMITHDKSGVAKDEEYKKSLEKIADGTLRTFEPTYFEDVIANMAGLGTDPRREVWFDFRNDVFWTMSEDNLLNLITVLEGVRKRWAEEKKDKEAVV